MLKRARRAAGFTLIEMAITLTILGILITLALPSMTAWLQNTQIRNSAEGMLAGLQLARTEALKRNSAVRFQLVSDLTASCTLTTSGRSWVVSLGDPSGGCNAAPSDTGAAIIQSKDAAEGSPNAIVASTGGPVVTFSGLGRVNGTSPITKIDVTNPGGGNCQLPGGGGGPMRCMEITVSSGGQVRMCDPAVTAATDPRKC